jgi:hypothetical protein
MISRPIRDEDIPEDLRDLNINCPPPIPSKGEVDLGWALRLVLR